MYACLFLPPPFPGGPAGPADPVCADLAALARDFSPRVETHGPRMVMLDVSGLGRLLGGAPAIGTELARAAASRGLALRVGLAATQVAAALVVLARDGVTVVPAGRESDRLAPFPLTSLLTLAGAVADGASGRPTRPASPTRPTCPTCPLVGVVVDPPALLKVLRRWGLETLGDLAALPTPALSERLGQEGLAWQRAARGQDVRPLRPDEPDEPFEESLELEWPVEGLEPLAFVVGRLVEALSARLEARDRAAAALHVRLRLVTRETFMRTLELPAAVREARVLRTIVLLDLESHPVPAGIDIVTIGVETVPGRILQHALFARALPAPEAVSTLLARLTALMGERRVGSAAAVDSHRPGAFTMTIFAPERPSLRLPAAAPGPAGAAAGVRARRPFPGRSRPLRDPASAGLLDPRRAVPPPRIAVRRFRLPVPARVAVSADGRPARVATDRRGLAGGEVAAAAGPWRTSGEWWRVSDARLQAPGTGRPQVGWNRDEWDVAIGDGTVYRLYRDRDRNGWFIDGILD